jgi:hypothetical protein
VARLNANELANEASTPTLLPAGDYLVAVVGVTMGETKSWKRYLEITMMTEIGAIVVDRVFGFDDNGKGPWAMRVIARIAREVAATLPPVEGSPVQPCEDFDWEIEADVAATALAGVFWAPVQVEPGSDKSEGGKYPDKNKINWSLLGSATREEVAQYRSGAKWMAASGNVKDKRALAVKGWLENLAASKALASGNAIPAKTASAVKSPIDDGMPF